MNITQDINQAPFPYIVLPEHIKQVMHSVYAETQAPYALICSIILSIMSISVQDLYDIAPKPNMRNPLVLYMIMLAESGERKSTAYKLLMSFIQDIEHIWETEYQKELLTYKSEFSIWSIKINALRKKLQQDIMQNNDTEIIILQLKECEFQRPQEPVRKRLIINDTTKAALKNELGNGWQSLVLLSDEAGSILSGELLTDPAVFNSLWSGSSIDVDRANHGSFKIKDARLSCLLMVQPELFDTFLKRKGEHIRSSGFFARTLFCKPISTIGFRLNSNEEFLIKNSNPEAINNFNINAKNIIERSIKRRNTNEPRKCITFSPEAQARWNAESDRVEHQSGPLGSLKNYRDYTSKHAEQVARIAGILEVFTTENEIISDNTMYAAICIANWYLDSFVYLMGSNNIPDDVVNADLLHNWLIQNSCRWINYCVPKNHILKFGPNPIRNKSSLDDALLTLTRKGVITIFKNQRKMYVQYNHQYITI